MEENPVRENIESVEELNHIELNENNVSKVVEDILEEVEIPEWDAPVFPEDPHVFTSFILVGNTINFAFNNPDTGEKYATEYMDIEWSGAFGMWATLHRAIYQEEKPVLDPEWLSDVTVSEFEEMTDPVGTEMPYIEKKSR